MKIVLSLCFCLIAMTSFAQQGYDLQPGKPQAVNGVEYGYEVRNEAEKNTNSGSSTRYQLTLYVTNRSGCTKYLWPRQTWLGETDQDVLAEFDCINATGQRFTEKSNKVRATSFSIPIRQTTRGADGKDITRTVTTKVGHILREGQTASAQMTVIVPQGQEPKLRVRVVEIIESFGY